MRGVVPKSIHHTKLDTESFNRYFEISIKNVLFTFNSYDTVESMKDLTKKELCKIAVLESNSCNKVGDLK